MSEVKFSLDEDTVGHLEQTRKGKPRRFVMLCKGPKILNLVLFKKGAKSKFIKQAKEAGTGEVCFGTVDGKGPDLIFHLARADGFEKEPTSNVKLKEFVNEATAGSFKPEFRIVDEAPLVLDEDDPLVKRYLFLKNNLHDVGPRSNDEQARLAELYRQAGLALEDGDEQNAKIRLDDLDNLLMRDYSEPKAPQQNDPREAVIQQLNKLKPAITDVFLRMPERKGELLHLVEECKRRITAGDLKGALVGLEDIRKFVDESTPKRQLPLRLGKMAESVELALQGKNAEFVQRLLAEYEQALLLDDYTTAGTKLDLLAGAVGISGGAQRETTRSWSEKFKFEPKDSLRNYTVGKELGSGGTGVANLLLPTEVGGEPLVAKFLQTEHSDRVDLLEAEQGVYEHLGDHPNLPRSLGVRNVDGRVALLLEAVDGPTMANTIANLNLNLKLGRISSTDYWAAMRYMTLKMLQTLAFMESKDCMHGDIRPTNVMIDSRTGEVKVIDLGGAVKIKTPMSQGSENYAPKEAIDNVTGKVRKGHIATNKYDIFSSGISVQNTAMTKSGLETEYTKLIKSMLDPDPEKRPTLEQALASKFFTESPLDEEQARAVLKRETAPKEPEQVIATVTISDQESWNSALKALVEAKKFDIGRAGVLIKRVSDLFRLITEPAAAYKKYSRELQWELKGPALEKAKEYAKEAVAAISKLMDISTETGPTLRTAWNWWADLRIDVDSVLELGPPVVTVKGFASRWRELKGAAEKSFDVMIANGFDTLACKQLEKETDELSKRNAPQKELDKVDQGSKDVVARRIKQLRATKEFESLKSLESFFGFTDNFSGALNDFEKVVGKNAKDFTTRRDKALEVAKKYFKAVVERSTFKFGDHSYGALVDLEGKNGEKGQDMIFKLRIGLNDLIASVIRIKA